MCVTKICRPIPDLSVPQLPARHLSLADDGTAYAGEVVAGPSKPRAAPELDRGHYERTLSKREKKAVSCHLDCDICGAALTLLATQEGVGLGTVDNDSRSSRRRSPPDAEGLPGSPAVPHSRPQALHEGRQQGRQGSRALPGELSDTHIS